MEILDPDVLLGTLCPAMSAEALALTVCGIYQFNLVISAQWGAPRLFVYDMTFDKCLINGYRSCFKWHIFHFPAIVVGYHKDTSISHWKHGPRQQIWLHYVYTSIIYIKNSKRTWNYPYVFSRSTLVFLDGTCDRYLVPVCFYINFQHEKSLPLSAIDIDAIAYPYWSHIWKMFSDRGLNDQRLLFLVGESASLLSAHDPLLLPTNLLCKRHQIPKFKCF